MVVIIGGRNSGTRSLGLRLAEEIRRRRIFNPIFFLPRLVFRFDSINSDHQTTRHQRNPMDTQVPDLALKNALMDAEYAALSARPCTDQSRRLVDEVFARVVVGGSKGRGGGYSDTKQQMFMAVMGFLGDLLWAAGNGWGWVYRSLQKKSFTGQDVGYHAFKRVLERLKELGFVEHKPGYR